MLEKRLEGEARRRRNLRVGLATCETEILDAQKLRYRVFAEEMGAKLPSRTPGVDRDIYDPFCEHLIVRDDDQGKIVGTYRILAPDAARRVGGYYSENEFDLTRLQHLRGRLVEIGRSCIDAEYRTGAVITLLWSGLARYMQERNYDYLVGCASVSMADGGHLAASLYNQLKEKHLAPLEYRVFPRTALHLSQGVLTSALLFPLLSHDRRARIRQQWSRKLLSILGIELHVDGAPLIARGLIVANHVSWLDIFVINAVTPAAFISKSEVRQWPVIGWLSAVNETVFLRRGSRGPDHQRRDRPLHGRRPACGPVSRRHHHRRQPCAAFPCRPAPAGHPHRQPDPARGLALPHPRWRLHPRCCLRRRSQSG